MPLDIYCALQTQADCKSDVLVIVLPGTSVQDSGSADCSISQAVQRTQILAVHPDI